MLKSEYVFNLKNITIFQDIDHDVFKRVFNASKLIEFQPSDNLGSLLSDDDLLIILQGELALYFMTKTVSHHVCTMKPGDTVSKATLLLTDTHDPLLCAISETVCLQIPIHLIKELTISHPLLKRNLLRSLQNKLILSFETLTKQIEQSKE
ncbi:cyclic nucleotide-binding domain-containing protein [Pontibacillus marinus]|uniref:Cyclic nucleotide-binding domain-containing protein n=1 Tax=Pontibacillus marinus BH030004 = DSM 16465 TaxID=1385511 RepID=A0A0A5G2C8_9BACI|nr:Crp/Fnr family transcriptional regulator [Pontibacillus marinus]KGX87256.1 hypothetical protein N783_10000 [Pontibacillus marinus BH030004 = DSM 16465]